MKAVPFFHNALIFLLLAFLSQTFLSAAPIPPPSQQRMTPTVKAVRKALPWVVSIGTTQQIIQVNDPFSLFFTDFFSQPQRIIRQFSPLGSGVIVDEGGLVVTNYHVVRRASSIEVQLWDGTSLQAAVVGYDVANDLCLLQLQEGHPQLTAAEFAVSEDLYLGETVIAIGNPFGLGQSVSTGVLSALNRSFQEGDFYFEELLQTDAAINPGNSGGPLVNLDGQLIGINQAIRADAQGIGFAIPLSHIERFLAYWLRPMHFSDAYLGIPPEAPIPQADDGNGIRLPEVLPGSPMAEAGLQEGDIINAVNGIPVQRSLDLGRAIWRLRHGDRVTLSTSRGEVTLTPSPMPDSLLIRVRLGLELTAPTPKLRKALGLAPNQKGLLVSDLLEDPIGGTQEAQWREVIRRGDILLQFADKEYPDLSDVVKTLRDSRGGDFQYVVFYASAVQMPIEIARLQLN